MVNSAVSLVNGLGAKHKFLWQDPNNLGEIGSFLHTTWLAF